MPGSHERSHFELLCPELILGIFEQALRCDTNSSGCIPMYLMVKRQMDARAYTLLSKTLRPFALKVQLQAIHLSLRGIDIVQEGGVSKTSSQELEEYHAAMHTSSVRRFINFFQSKTVASLHSDVRIYQLSLVHQAIEGYGFSEMMDLIRPCVARNVIIQLCSTYENVVGLQMALLTGSRVMEMVLTERGGDRYTPTGDVKQLVRPSKPTFGQDFFSGLKFLSLDRANFEQQHKEDINVFRFLPQSLERLIITAPAGFPGDHLHETLLNQDWLPRLKSFRVAKVHSYFPIRPVGAGLYQFGAILFSDAAARRGIQCDVHDWLDSLE